MTQFRLDGETKKKLTKILQNRLRDAHRKSVANDTMAATARLMAETIGVVEVTKNLVTDALLHEGVQNP